MSLGSFLFGVGVVLLTVVYLARPFSRARAMADFGRAIDGWVEKSREGQEVQPEGFCGQCGRRVGPDDRFCPGCGKSLAEGGAR